MKAIDFDRLGGFAAKVFVGSVPFAGVSTIRVSEWDKEAPVVLNRLP
jgi:hypothetical protein